MLQALLLTCFILVLFALTELLYHRFGVAAEYTRKIAHIGGGLLCLNLPKWVPDPWYVLALTLAFCGLIGVSAKVGELRSIHGISRGGYGGLLFPVAIGLLYFNYQFSKDPLQFTLSLLILTISDSIAYFVGTRFPWRRYSIFQGTKTLSGSLAFFATTLLLCALARYLHPTSSLPFLRQVVVAVATTAAEAIGSRGYDNITVPLACVLSLGIGA